MYFLKYFIVLFVLLDIDCNNILDDDEFYELYKDAGKYIPNFPTTYKEASEIYGEGNNKFIKRSGFISMCHKYIQLVKGLFSYRETLIKYFFDEKTILKLSTQEIDVFTIISSYYNRKVLKTERKISHTVFTVNPEPNLQNKYMNKRYEKINIKRSVH